MKNIRRLNLMVFVSLALVNLPGFGCAKSVFAAAGIKVSLIADKEVGPAVQHGLKKTKLTLQDKGVPFEEVSTVEKARGDILIVAGLAEGSGEAAKLLNSLRITPPQGAESLMIQNTRWRGKKVLLVSGADDRGLMYALLDVADRIDWSTDKNNPLKEVRETREKPAVPERALSIYTMQREYVESFLYDKAYWARYLDTLAENRFNTFVFILGYNPSTPHSPAYPYFFDVEGYPDVYVEGLSKKEQQRNLDALNRIIKMSHDRGLNFTLGIWDHISRRPEYHHPVGVTQQNAVPYTKAALAKLLRLVPDLDAIQFRMHWESGLSRDEKELLDFWGSVFQTIKNNERPVRVDMRAKGLPDAVIEKAREVGVDFRVTTKYWAEQMGLPFHPTHINRRNQLDRRHGYADLLCYPQRYRMHWKLWNAGTTKLLLWGDPEYVRRFAASTHLYDGDGFEVNGPLATKMGVHPLAEPFDILKSPYQYYDWEFERYWHFFQVFGRLGYNPDAPPEVWEKEFERRFGKEAAPYVQRALHRASQVLPRTIAYAMFNFPTMSGFPEKDRGGELAKYSKTRPSDIQIFLGMDEAAQYHLEGEESAKIWPRETSQWFARASADILDLTTQAEKRIGKNKNKEFNSTIVDLKILANLALYHSRRIPAGVSWALFDLTGDVAALNDAISHETNAIDAYEKIVKAAGDVYADDLMMGRSEPPHWRDELELLKIDLEKLQVQRKKYQPAIKADGPVIAHVPVRRSAPGEDLVIRATVSGEAPVSSVRVGFGNVQQGYRYVSMKQVEPFVYSTVIAGSEVTEDLNYFIEVVDQTGKRVTYPKNGKANPIAVMVTNDNEPPVLTHTPITNTPAHNPLTITADVRDPSGVKWVRLRYRGVTQFQDYQSVEMHPTGKKNEYQVVIPREQIDLVTGYFASSPGAILQTASVQPKWDFMYLFEVMDNKDNGKIYPDLESQTPYVIVRLRR